MDILLVSFVYPQVQKFLKDFFVSLKKQSFMKFDTLIFNDGMKINLKKYGYYGKVINNKYNLSMWELRKEAINYGIDKNYDLLVFIDSDDVLDRKRIERLKFEYNPEINFFYNDLYYLENKNKDFFNNQLPLKTRNEAMIENYNYLGMSNTAINLSKDEKIISNIPIYNEIIAFDWYLYSYLLLKGAIGKKINSKTYYRIHNNNVAGRTNRLNEIKLNFGLKVKKEHYSVMSRFDEKYNNNLRNMIELENKLSKETFRKKYIKYINNKTSNIFWWQNIKSLEEVEGGLLND